MMHRVLVQRPTTTQVNLKTTETRPIVANAMPCLVEGLAGRERDSILGTIPDARFKISWADGVDLREHDIVKYGGAWYRVRNATRTTRAGSRGNWISTAILEQDHGRHEEG
jgi:hypothetical protein